MRKYPNKNYCISDAFTLIWRCRYTALDPIKSIKCPAKYAAFKKFAVIKGNCD